RKISSGCPLSRGSPLRICLACRGTSRSCTTGLRRTGPGDRAIERSDTLVDRDQLLQAVHLRKWGDALIRVRRLGGLQGLQITRPLSTRCRRLHKLQAVTSHLHQLHACSDTSSSRQSYSMSLFRSSDVDLLPHCFFVVSVPQHHPSLKNFAHPSQQPMERER